VRCTNGSVALAAHRARSAPRAGSERSGRRRVTIEVPLRTSAPSRARSSAFTLPTGATVFEPRITTLPNGLRVITASIPTAQAAAVAYFVGIGSRGEQPRTNGLSHYIEHMLFKGTERRPTAPEISQAIEGAGGS